MAAIAKIIIIRVGDAVLTPCFVTTFAAIAPARPETRAYRRAEAVPALGTVGTGLIFRTPGPQNTIGLAEGVAKFDTRRQELYVTITDTDDPERRK